MNPATLRTSLAAVAAVLVAVPLLVIMFLIDTDETACPATGSATTAPAGGADLPAGSRAWPMAAGTYTISDTFGTRGGTHKGIDMAAPLDTPIYAAADGVVTDSGTASGFGHWIVLSHNESGHTWSTVYGHMFATGLLVAAGDSVSAGQQIAKVGNDGDTTGSHLHFEVWDGGRAAGTAVDPQPWLAGAAQPGTGSGATTPAATTAAPTTSAPAPATTTVPADQAGAGASTTTASGSAAPTTTGSGCASTTGYSGNSSGSNLADDTEVPADLVTWYQRGGTVCPQISASLLAAQGKAETGFQRGLTSPSGAQGLGQFLPGTAAATAPDGQPYVIDADGNGSASVWDDGDAIVGQARYMCAIAAKIDGWISEGKVADVTDRRELYIAAYNAGEGAVLSSGGFPTGSPDYVTETRPYVDRILAWEPGFAKKMT